jgi:hypothetical protein
MRKDAWGIILLTTVLFLLTLIGCVSSSPTVTLSPSPSAIALTRLLIDTSALPDGWYVSRGPEEYPEQQGQEDSVYVGFNTKTFESPTLHIVLHYKNSEYASKKYKQYLPAYFNSVGRLTPWELPATLRYQSEIADQSQSACANFQTTSDTAKRYTKCVTMTQYEKYISIFITYISEGAMNYADLENTLQAIDKRMLIYR